MRFRILNENADQAIYNDEEYNNGVEGSWAFFAAKFSETEDSKQFLGIVTGHQMLHYEIPGNVVDSVKDLSSGWFSFSARGKNIDAETFVELSHSGTTERKKLKELEMFDLPYLPCSGRMWEARDEKGLLLVALHQDYGKFLAKEELGFKRFARRHFQVKEIAVQPYKKGVSNGPWYAWKNYVTMAPRSEMDVDTHRRLMAMHTMSPAEKKKAMSELLYGKNLPDVGSTREAKRAEDAGVESAAEFNSMLRQESISFERLVESVLNQP